MFGFRAQLELVDLKLTMTASRAQVVLMAYLEHPIKTRAFMKQIIRLEVPRQVAEC